MCSVHIVIEVDNAELDQSALEFVHGATRMFLAVLTTQGIEGFVGLRENRFVCTGLSEEKKS